MTHYDDGGVRRRGIGWPGGEEMSMVVFIGDLFYHVGLTHIIHDGSWRDCAVELRDGHADP